jgi:pimeloyl-ACP methyl ester carboxylesterase
LGDSARPGTGYDVPSTAADISTLVEHLDLGPVHLAGQDWGGSVAFACAAQHPSQVRRLAVLEALPAGPWTSTGTGRTAWFAEFHRIPGLPEKLVHDREDDYLAWFYSAYSATPGVPTSKAVAEYLRTYRQPGAMSAAFARYREVDSEISHNTRHVAQPLRLPVLAVGGERVFGSAVADNLRNGAATNVRSEVLAGCGHYLSEERPDDVARVVTEFFQPNKNLALA